MAEETCTTQIPPHPTGKKLHFKAKVMYYMTKTAVERSNLSCSQKFVFIHNQRVPFKLSDHKDKNS